MLNCAGDETDGDLQCKTFKDLEEMNKRLMNNQESKAMKNKLKVITWQFNHIHFSNEPIMREFGCQNRSIIRFCQT